MIPDHAARTLLAYLEAAMNGRGTDGRAWRRLEALAPAQARMIRRLARSAREVCELARVGIVDGEDLLEVVTQLVRRVDALARAAGVALNVDRWVHNATEGERL